MYRIFKYVLDLEDEQTISVAEGAESLSVQLQNGKICVWAAHRDYTKELTEPRKFYIVGTGNPFEVRKAKRFIGTVQQGDFVWHVFEDK